MTIWTWSSLCRVSKYVVPHLTYLWIALCLTGGIREPYRHFTNYILVVSFVHGWRPVVHIECIFSLWKKGNLQFLFLCILLVLAEKVNNVKRHQGLPTNYIYERSIVKKLIKVCESSSFRISIPVNRKFWEWNQESLALTKEQVS